MSFVQVIFSNFSLQCFSRPSHIPSVLLLLSFSPNKFQNISIMYRAIEISFFDFKKKVMSSAS